MSKIFIQPTLLQGTVTIPPSKSMAHRAIIAACLSNGTSHIKNIDLSDDIIATIEVMKNLGAEVSAENNRLLIDGMMREKNKHESMQKILDCRESGSTLRFLLPIALALGGNYRFVGEGNLGKRPVTPYLSILNKQNIIYKSKTDILDISVCGNLSAGVFELDGNISSQFITGLLFALPLLKKNSKIILTSKLESKSYVDLSLQVLSDFGIEIVHHNYTMFEIQGRQEYKPRDYCIEGDFSQAAFFLCAGALGADVTLQGLDMNSLQGDREIIAILKQMGADVMEESDKIKAKSKELKGIVIDASQIPDIIPVLAATTCLAKGQTVIKNAQRLRIKECDRLSATVKELTALGAVIREEPDWMHIIGVDHLAGGCEVQSHGDHRIAMMLAIIAQKCNQPIIINEYKCVSKSYPNFFRDYQALGGEINEQYVER
jgi:3-phosphoshikimate 1-carboxyvinyltransferase